MAILNCPDCGKLITTVFPMHDCTPDKPTKNKQREDKDKLKKERKVNGNTTNK